MRLNRPLHLTLVLAAAAVLVSCVETTAPEAPTASATTQASPELLEFLTPTLQRVGLLRCEPMPAVFVRERIGPEGGVINIGPHELRIPRGALSERVMISAYAPRGRVNVVEFAPHGLEFDRPAELTMSYANCNTLGSLLPKHIAYVNDDLSIIHLLETIDNLRRREVSSRLDHFSEYAVAW